MESAASCVIDADHIGEIAFANFSSCCRSKLRHMEVSLKEMLDSISFKQH